MPYIRSWEVYIRSSRAGLARRIYARSRITHVYNISAYRITVLL